MSEHLSALQLDEVAAEAGPLPEHLATCALCLQKVEVLRAESLGFLSRPEARRQLEKLAPAPAKRSSFLRVLAVALPLAAGLALFLNWQRAPVEDRIKGSPTVMLLDEKGDAVTQAAPGTKLTLVVGAAGYPRVEVFAIDAAGQRLPLFAGNVAPGARVPLMQLEVTPGDVTVTAVFERDDHQTQSASVRLTVP